MHHIGIDISKTKLDCCWLSDPENNKIKTKVFKNTHAGHDDLAKCLTHQTKAAASSIQVVMESTGIYHEPMACTLHKLGFKVCVLNPARSKDFANSLGNTHKTDLKDSVMLALFSHRMMPRAWQPESPEVRELKALLARFDALETDLQRELNRLEKAQFSCSSDRIIESITHMVTYLTAEKKQLEQSIDDQYSWCWTSGITRYAERLTRSSICLCRTSGCVYRFDPTDTRVRTMERSKPFKQARIIENQSQTLYDRSYFCLL